MFSGQPQASIILSPCTIHDYYKVAGDRFF